MLMCQPLAEGLLMLILTHPGQQMKIRDPDDAELWTEGSLLTTWWYLRVLFQYTEHGLELR